MLVSSVMKRKESKLNVCLKARESTKFGVMEKPKKCGYWIIAKLWKPRLLYYKVNQYSQHSNYRWLFTSIRLHRNFKQAACWLPRRISLSVFYKLYPPAQCTWIEFCFYEWTVSSMLPFFSEVVRWKKYHLKINSHNETLLFF